jgi:hypothetical protein
MIAGENAGSATLLQHLVGLKPRSLALLLGTRFATQATLEGPESGTGRGTTSRLEPAS